MNALFSTQSTYMYFLQLNSACHTSITCTCTCIMMYARIIHVYTYCRICYYIQYSKHVLLTVEFSTYFLQLNSAMSYTYICTIAYHRVLLHFSAIMWRETQNYLTTDELRSFSTKILLNYTYMYVYACNYVSTEWFTTLSRILKECGRELYIQRRREISLKIHCSSSYYFL